MCVGVIVYMLEASLCPSSTVDLDFWGRVSYYSASHQVGLAGWPVCPRVFQFLCPKPWYDKYVLALGTKLIFLCLKGGISHCQPQFLPLEILVLLLILWISNEKHSSMVTRPHWFGERHLKEASPVISDLKFPLSNIGKWTSPMLYSSEVIKIQWYLSCYIYALSWCSVKSYHLHLLKSIYSSIKNVDLHISWVLWTHVCRYLHETLFWIFVMFTQK